MSERPLNHPSDCDCDICVSWRHMHAGQNIVEERAKTRGDYVIQSKMEQALKVTFRMVPGWNRLPKTQQSTLEAMAMKIARILTDEGREPDNWRDIAGYATLEFNLLTKGTHK